MIHLDTTYTQTFPQHVQQAKPVHQVPRHKIGACSEGTTTRGPISYFFYWIVQSVKGFLLSWRSADYFENLDAAGYKSISPIQMRWLSAKQMDGILESESGLQVLSREHWEEAGVKKLAYLETSSLRKLGPKLSTTTLKGIYDNRDHKNGDKFDLFMTFSEVLSNEKLTDLFGEIFYQERVEAFQKVPTSTKAYIWENHHWRFESSSKRDILEEVKDHELKEFINSFENGLGELWEALPTDPSKKKRWEEAFTPQQMVNIFETINLKDQYESLSSEQKNLALTTSSPKKWFELYLSSVTKREEILDLIRSSSEISEERKKELLDYFFDKTVWKTGVFRSSLQAIVKRFSADQIDHYLNKSGLTNRLKLLSHLWVEKLKTEYDKSTNKRMFIALLNKEKVKELYEALNSDEEKEFLNNQDPDTVLTLMEGPFASILIVWKLTDDRQIRSLFKKYPKDDFFEGPSTETIMGAGQTC